MLNKWLKSVSSCLSRKGGGRAGGRPHPGGCHGLHNHPEAPWVTEQGNPNPDSKLVGIANVNEWFRPGKIWQMAPNWLLPVGNSGPLLLDLHLLIFFRKNNKLGFLKIGDLFLSVDKESAVYVAYLHLSGSWKKYS